MNFDEHNGITIEIDDDIWDVVSAIIALVCEVNGELYFDSDDTDYEVTGTELLQCFEDPRDSEMNASSMESERSRLRPTTAAILLSIVQAVSETFPRPRPQTSHHEQAISKIGMIENAFDARFPDTSQTVLLPTVPEAKQDKHNLDILNITIHESKIGIQVFDEVGALSSQDIQLSSHQERLPRSDVIESKDPETLPGSEVEEIKVHVSNSFDSLKPFEPSRLTCPKMHFAFESDSTFTENHVVTIALLLDIVTGSKMHVLKQKSFEIACIHEDLRKIASIIKFSCFENEKAVTPLFTGLSLLHILCISKETFAKSTYDDLIDIGCKPDEESSNGCNVYAFAACQGNFEAMRHIRDTHSNIWRSTLCRSRNRDRNVLHCIMDHASPFDYDLLFEFLGPSVCTDMCTTLNGDLSPVFIALKLGNFAFLESISKQAYIWNFTKTDLGDERTFLAMMMINPHVHGFLLQMLSNISSLESFVVASNERPRGVSIVFQAYQLGHISIVFHVLKQQHLLYFSELDKIESFITQLDTKHTRSSLIAVLSALLEKHQSNAVVIWHCIHLVTSLSHDEEMALDLLSTANLETVKNHHHWRSFDRFTGESSLHIAAKKGWTEILTCLYDLGHDINPLCFMMRTPFHTSALNNSIKCISLLNNLGADPSIESGDGKSPIACSIESNNIECSMEILNNFGSRKSLFQTDFKGASPLMRALESKQLEVAHKILKQYPEQANFVSMSGTNIFHAAAPHLASVQQLVSWSNQERKDIWAFLQQKNNDGETPKDIAAHRGYLDSLRFFIQIYQAKGSISVAKSLQEMDVHYSESKEAFSQTDFSSPSSVHKFLSNHLESINCYDFYHRTPLILTVLAKNLQGAQDLIDAGASILETDSLGNSAMHYMFLSKREHSLWMWEESTTSDTDPSDVLQCIIQRNSEDSVAKCLTLKNKAGHTPFGLAVTSEFFVDVALLCGEVKFPKRLLNVQLPNGTYCLHVACSKNLINLAVMFLNLGSDPSVFDSNRMSPEYISRSHGHNAITLILMQFCNALKIQCAIRSYLSRVHALANRADCNGVQNIVFSIIENSSASMQQYADLRSNFPRANWNAIEHPKYPDVVPMAYAAM
jgi:ankyrin repeat protein